MIKYLDGIFETVDFQSGSQINLFYNQEYEDYPPHWHTAFEVIMPVVGTYRVVCSGTEYNLQEGDILIICPCMVHELFAPLTGERIIFQPSVSGISIGGLQTLISSISPALHITRENNPRIYSRIRDTLLYIKDEYLSKPPYADLSIMAGFLSILAEIGKEWAVRPAPVLDSRQPSRQKEYLEKFLAVEEYIDEHFTEDLHLEDVAKKAGFSKYYFSRLFKQYSDVSFYKYLNQKRINYAKSLLPDPELTVLDVAIRSGFPSPSAFWRMFRQFNGCTPAEFRRMYQWG